MTFEKCLDSNVDGSFAPRHDWTRGEIRDLFALPFPDLIYRAQTVHRQHFDPSEVQVSTLLSIKTGGCPEDCAYCPQSATSPPPRMIFNPRAGDHVNTGMPRKRAIVNFWELAIQQSSRGFRRDENPQSENV